MCCHFQLFICRCNICIYSNCSGLQWSAAHRRNWIRCCSRLHRLCLHVNTRCSPLQNLDFLWSAFKGLSIHSGHVIIFQDKTCHTLIVWVWSLTWHVAASCFCPILTTTRWPGLSGGGKKRWKSIIFPAFLHLSLSLSADSLLQTSVTSSSRPLRLNNWCQNEFGVCGDSVKAFWKHFCFWLGVYFFSRVLLWRKYEQKSGNVTLVITWGAVGISLSTGQQVKADLRRLDTQLL